MFEQLSGQRRPGLSTTRKTAALAPHTRCVLTSALPSSRVHRSHLITITGTHPWCSCATQVEAAEEAELKAHSDVKQLQLELEQELADVRDAKWEKSWLAWILLGPDAQRPMKSLQQIMPATRTGRAKADAMAAVRDPAALPTSSEDAAVPSALPGLTRVLEADSIAAKARDDIAAEEAIFASACAVLDQEAAVIKDDIAMRRDLSADGRLTEDDVKYVREQQQQVISKRKKQHEKYSELITAIQARKGIELAELRGEGVAANAQTTKDSAEEMLADADGAAIEVYTRDCSDRLSTDLVREGRTAGYKDKRARAKEEWQDLPAARQTELRQRAAVQARDHIVTASAGRKRPTSNSKSDKSEQKKKSKKMKRPGAKVDASASAALDSGGEAGTVRADGGSHSGKRKAPHDDRYGSAATTNPPEPGVLLSATGRTTPGGHVEFTCGICLKRCSGQSAHCANSKGCNHRIHGEGRAPASCRAVLADVDGSILRFCSQDCAEACGRAACGACGIVLEDGSKYRKSCFYCKTFLCCGVKRPKACGSANVDNLYYCDKCGPQGP